MSHDTLAERLASALPPVRRRRVGVDAAILGGLFLLELALFLLIGLMRHDMPRAMNHMSFWWKLASLGVIAAVAAPTAILSFDPIRSPRRGLRLVLVAIALSLAAGWAVDALAENGPALLVARLDWRNGLGCVWKMAVLSLPPLVGLAFLMRRGAATEPEASALAVGLAASALGAFVFVFACPNDDPLYIAVWYAVGCGLVTAVARLILPRLTRW